MSEFYKKLGNEYLFLSKYEEAERNYREFGKICEEINNKKGFVDFLNNLGVVYIHSYKYSKSEKFLLRALQSAKECKYKEAVSLALNNLGILYNNTGKTSKTLECYFESLKINEEIKNITGLSRTYNNIAIVYKNRKDYVKAMSYIEKGILLDKKHGNKNLLSSKYNTKGLLYALQNRIDKGLPYFKKALKLSLEIEDYDASSKYYGNIAISYKNSNNIPFAILNYKKSFEMAKKTNNITSQIIFFANMGCLYIDQNKFKKSELYLKKALKMSKNYKILFLTRNVYRNLYELSDARKNYKDSIHYYIKYTEIKDKILNKQSNDKIAEMQTKYESEKKDKEITILSKNNLLLKKDNQIKKLEITQKDFKTKILIVGFALVLIALILLFLKYKKLFAFWKKKNHISSYRLVDKIGSGGMAVVFKGFHTKNKTEPVAIKILKEDINADADQKKRFFNEANILKNINHENIVKIFEVGEFDNQLFIAMEYIKGNTLAFEIHKNKNLLGKHGIFIMTQLINALFELHKREIIHRDLKPENIMLSEKNGVLSVKLLDFGLAKTQSLNSLTKTGMILGTIFYMPPEQLFHSVFSFAGDIYSLGIIFYEMLTGERPYKGDTTGEIMFEILNKDPDPIIAKNHDISEEINKIIFGMMNKEPQKRPDIITLMEKFNHFAV